MVFGKCVVFGNSTDRATPMRTVSGSGSLWNNCSTSLGIRGACPYLHVYVVTVILQKKTRVEVSLCFIRHL